MSLTELDYAINAVVTEALQNHQWVSYSNFIGFVSGIAFKGATSIEPTNAHLPLDQFREQSAAMERWAFGFSFDGSQPLHAGALRGIAAMVRRLARDDDQQPGLTPPCKLGTFESHFFSLTGTTAAALSAVVERKPLRDATKVAVIGAIASKLSTADIAACARPWRMRDSAPESDRALAFEAALDAGQRDFAYRMFAPLPS